MNKQGLLAGAIALAVVAAAIGGILLATRKNRVELTGEVLKVRSHQIDSEHTIALLDVRLRNPSTQQFMVRDVEVFVDEAGGKSTQADMFAESDVQRVIDYYPALGAKYNPGLLRRDRIQSAQMSDRTLAVNVPMADERLANRTRLRLVIHDMDGATTEIAERR